MKNLSIFRQKLSAGECLCGLWVTLEAGAVTDVAAGLGLDWVVIDAVSGHLDWSETGEHLRALKRSQTVALVHVGDESTAQMDRAFELGADGIVVRGVKTGEQLYRVVDRAKTAATKARAVSTWKHDTVARMPVVVPVLEPDSVVDELLQVENVDAYLCEGLHTEPGAALGKELTAVLSRKKHAAVVARTDGEILECRALGINMLGLGSDAGIIFAGIRSALAGCAPLQQSRGAQP